MTDNYWQTYENVKNNETINKSLPDYEKNFYERNKYTIIFTVSFIVGCLIFYYYYPDQTKSALEFCYSDIKHRVIEFKSWVSSFFSSSGGDSSPDAGGSTQKSKSFFQNIHDMFKEEQAKAGRKFRDSDYERYGILRNGRIPGTPTPEGSVPGDHLLDGVSSKLASDPSVSMEPAQPEFVQGNSSTAQILVI